ncbi:hypothetical protein OB13_15345 [Pontibacter sp. HJ8]
MFAILGIACTSYAQGITFGPRAGVNIATQKLKGGNDARERESFNETVKYNAGPQVGAVVNFAVNELLSFQPEVLLSEKGFRLEERQGGNHVKLVRKATYLEVPLLSKFTFGSEKLKGFTTMGPYAGYWMGGGKSFEMNDSWSRESIDFDKVDYNRLDVGGSFGIGMACQLGTDALNLDVRYNFGLSDVNRYDAGDGVGEPKLSNRVFGISLAYLFGAN